MGEACINTPYFVVDELRLVKNLEILKQVSEAAGCRILLAQKAFSMFSCYPLLRQYLGPLSRGEEDKPITASIINNYVRLSKMEY